MTRHDTTGTRSGSASGLGITADRAHLRRGDAAAAMVLALLLGTIFWMLSSGASLRITFIPGLAVSLGIVVWMWRERCPLPAAERVLPLYMLTLAWQGIHFAEEYQTGFWSSFPKLYGAPAYSPVLFVWVNMFSYAVFSLATLATLVRRIRPALLPSMFFVVYGAIGNVISHITWAVMARGYFPGLFTALGYLILGPVLLNRMWIRATPRRIAAVFAACAIIMVPLELQLAAV